MKNNLDALLLSMIGQKELPMADALVTHRGEEVYRGVFGYADLAQQKPLTENAVFRIFSMTKVITAACMLQLTERGAVTLDDPISRYLPGFEHQQVVHTDVNGWWELRPAGRANTIRTLLTMTSGIPYYHAGRSRSEDEMARLYAELDASAWSEKPVTTIEVANRIGRNPLAFEPGTGFYYGLGMEVAAAIVELVSGMRFGDYCRGNIFEPLGMNDTGFYAPQEKQSRLCELYSFDKDGKAVSGLTKKDDRQLAPPAFEEGGDGLVTTARDYNRFIQMLASGGTLDGVRILSRATVRLMSSNHLSHEVLPLGEAALRRLEGGGYGYGLGVRVLVNPPAAPVLSAKGQWGWLGKGGSWFCIDPIEELTILFLTQSTAPETSRQRIRFVNAVYAAMNGQA